MIKKYLMLSTLNLYNILTSSKEWECAVMSYKPTTFREDRKNVYIVCKWSM